MTKPITPAERARLRELEAKATPGPWRVWLKWNGAIIVTLSGEKCPKHTGRCGCAIEDDAQLIATARNSIAGYEAALELAIGALRRIQGPCPAMFCVSAGSGRHLCDACDARATLRQLKGDTDAE